MILNRNYAKKNLFTSTLRLKYEWGDVIIVTSQTTKYDTIVYNKLIMSKRKIVKSTSQTHLPNNF